MNVCFLDVDGVLNSSSTTELSPEGYIGVDNDKIAILAKIVESLNMKIVLSSDWKLSFTTKKDKDADYLKEKLQNYWLDIFDFTPDISARLRGLEISNWLDNHEVDKYIILDDNIFEFAIYPELSRHVIRTNENENDIFAANGVFDCVALSNNPVEEVLKTLSIIQEKLQEKDEKEPE